MTVLSVHSTPSGHKYVSFLSTFDETFTDRKTRTDVVPGEIPSMSDLLNLLDLT